MFSRAEAIGWLESVTAALDCYNWVLGEQLFSPSELFDGKILTLSVLKVSFPSPSLYCSLSPPPLTQFSINNTLSTSHRVYVCLPTNNADLTHFSVRIAKPRKSHEKPSNLFQSLEFFVSTLALHGIEAAVSCFDSSLSTVHTPREVEEYNRVKCSLVLHLLTFASILLEKHTKQAFSVRLHCLAPNSSLISNHIPYIQLCMLGFSCLLKTTQYLESYESLDAYCIIS